MEQNLSHPDSSSRFKYDAILIPGGGLDVQHALPHPWVCARLDAALALKHKTRYFILLSRGTTHKPPLYDYRGFPISEADASAKYLLENGVEDPARILLDTWSLDTIGNAYFARLMMCDPMGMRRLCIITSMFHMNRTKLIFEWIFSLDGRHTKIDFVCTPDRGMSSIQSATRSEKEKGSIQHLTANTIPKVSSMTKLAHFVLIQHQAYNASYAKHISLGDNGSRRAENGDSSFTSTY